MNRLFNRVFGLERSLEEFNWKFRISQWSQELPVDAVICEKDGEIVGMYPSLATKWVHAGRTLSSMQPVDNCIAEEHRAKGIQKGMFSLVQSSAVAGLHFGFGFPGGHHKHMGQAALGYRRVAGFTTLSASLNALRAVSHSSNYRTQYITHFDEQHDAWWHSRGARLFTIVIPRVASYVNWRFTEHPRKKFRIIQLLATQEPSTILGYAVLGFSFQSGRIQATIYDFMCDFDPECVLTLALACIEAAREAHACDILFPSINHNPYYAGFESLGFMRHEMLDPIFVVGCWCDEILESRYLSRPEDWFVSFGDTDL